MPTRPRFALLAATLAVATASCGQRGGLVYVLEAPQTVTLTASATPTSAQRGDTIVLSAERRTEGKWKRVPLSDVRPGQCWVYQPPAAHEPQVADNVHWQILPENAAVLSRDFRTDHTRAVTVVIKGTITLTPISALKCEDDRVVTGTPVSIEVS